jgi:hypothetical protein
MGLYQNRARSALAKLAYFLGAGTANMKAAADELHAMCGTRDPAALHDTQAKEFSRAVIDKYGKFRSRTSASDNDVERLTPSKDASGKQILDAEFAQRAWSKFNRVKAGVQIKRVDEDE